jgi:hypothetical protein
MTLKKGLDFSFIFICHCNPAEEAEEAISISFFEFVQLLRNKTHKQSPKQQMKGPSSLQELEKAGQGKERKKRLRVQLIGFEGLR